MSEEQQIPHDDRVTVTPENLFDLLRIDLKLLRKLRYLVRYYRTQNLTDVTWQSLLQQSDAELTEKIDEFARALGNNGIDLQQNIDEFPSDQFQGPVPGRECLFARSGVFMDTKACFQTRDVPLNTIAPFQSVQSGYFMLEHMHEAFEMNCALRVRQVDYLHTNEPDIFTVIQPDGAEQTTDNPLKSQLKNIRALIFAVGKYANQKHKLYAGMLHRD